ncbi:MAG TPA: hypothetical protein VKB34_18820, partial [Povalibacter sp.]|nr:hypothetical protein [Povalibacter sp.]
MNKTKIIILSVHYKYPELLRDQWERIRACTGPVRVALNAELRYHPIVHGGSTPEVVEVARAVSEHEGHACSHIHLQTRPASSASAHGDSLAAALLQLTRDSPLQDEDLIAIMDHD